MRLSFPVDPRYPHSHGQNCERGHAARRNPGYTSLQNPHGYCGVDGTWYADGGHNAQATTTFNGTARCAELNPNPYPCTHYPSPISSFVGDEVNEQDLIMWEACECILGPDATAPALAQQQYSGVGGMLDSYDYQQSPSQPAVVSSSELSPSQSLSSPSLPWNFAYEAARPCQSQHSISPFLFKRSYPSDGRRTRRRRERIQNTRHVVTPEPVAVQRSKRGRKQTSCLNCVKSRHKCDEELPCGACERKNIPCVYAGARSSSPVVCISLSTEVMKALSVYLRVDNTFVMLAPVSLVKDALCVSHPHSEAACTVTVQRQHACKALMWACVAMGAVALKSSLTRTYLEHSRQHMKECFEVPTPETLWALCALCKAYTVQTSLDAEDCDRSLARLYSGYAFQIYSELISQENVALESDLISTALQHVSGLVDKSTPKLACCGCVFDLSNPTALNGETGNMMNNERRSSNSTNLQLQVLTTVLAISKASYAALGDPNYATEEHLHTIVTESLNLRLIRGFVPSLFPHAYSSSIGFLMFAYARLRQVENLRHACVQMFEWIRANPEIHRCYRKNYILHAFFDSLLLLRPDYRRKVNTLKLQMPLEKDIPGLDDPPVHFAEDIYRHTFWLVTELTGRRVSPAWMECRSSQMSTNSAWNDLYRDINPDIDPDDDFVDERWNREPIEEVLANLEQCR